MSGIGRTDAENQAILDNHVCPRCGGTVSMEYDYGDLQQTIQVIFWHCNQDRLHVYADDPTYLGNNEFSHRPKWKR